MARSLAAGISELLTISRTPIEPPSGGITAAGPYRLLLFAHGFYSKLEWFTLRNSAWLTFFRATNTVGAFVGAGTVAGA